MGSQNLVPGFYATYTSSNLTEEELNNYLDMPGATYSDDNSSVFVPTYEIDPHPIMFSDELGAESNFTQWFSGIQLRFDNYWFELPQTNSFAGISDIKFMNNNGTDDESDDTDIIDSIIANGGSINDNDIDDNTLLLPWMMGYFDTPGQWWNNSGGDNPQGAEMLVFSADKKEYNVGEKINIELPEFNQGRALVSIESGSKVVQTFWVYPKENNHKFSFDASGKQIKNAKAKLQKL